MTALKDIIVKEIASSGPMRLDRFMTLALAHPVHGYYMRRDPFGEGGDFITAPEISQIFGELIGAWIADLWIKAGQPPSFIMLECGPGRGTLMADALRATARVPGFHDALQLYLQEISPALKEAQAATLAGFEPRWITDLDQLPHGQGPLFVVANEFLDALPIRQFVKTRAGWAERCVGLGEGDTLSFGLKPVAAELVRAFCDDRILLSMASGDIIETSPDAKDWAGRLADIIKTLGGAALLIDYGYTQTQAGDSFQALRGHKFSDPLADIGCSDLTAHVDFQSVSQTAIKNGLIVHGPAPQGAFLSQLGLWARYETLARKATQAQRITLKQGCERLTDTADMGSLFKVLAITHLDLGKGQVLGFNS